MFSYFGSNTSAKESGSSKFDDDEYVEAKKSRIDLLFLHLNLIVSRSTSTSMTNFPS